MNRPTLYHFTCGHGRDALGGKGRLTPIDTRCDPSLIDGWPLVWRLTASYVWMTTNPDGAGCGLEVYPDSVSSCDRLEYRYRVREVHLTRPWWDITIPITHRRDLETARPGLDPASWYVASIPVLAVYDPPL